MSRVPVSDWKAETAPSVSSPGGTNLSRSETIKKAAFDAIKIRQRLDQPVLLITSHLPEGGAAATMLADCADDFFDVLATKGDFAGFQRLQRYLHDDLPPGPLPAPWREEPSRQEPNLFDMTEQVHEPEVVRRDSDDRPDATSPP